mgnify:CR=1 FL=1
MMMARTVSARALLLAALWSSAYGWGLPWRRIEHGPSSRISTGGWQIRYREAGSGPPIVLLHPPPRIAADLFRWLPVRSHPDVAVAG